MKLDKYADILSSGTLFKGLETVEIVKVFETLDYKIEKYSKEDIIFVEDDDCNNLSVILEGNVEIQKIDMSGKVLSVAKFEPGDVFGELLIFSNNRFPMTVVSNTSSTIMHISKDSVIRLCQAETKFLYAYLNLISSKAFMLNQKLKEVTLKTIRQQIAEFIMKQSKLQKSDTINLNMTKKEWADKLGVQRPSLSRELIKMKEEGILDLDKNLITILDKEALEFSI